MVHASLPADPPRILVVRHAEYQRDFFRVIEDWIRRYEPQCDGLLDVQDLPCALPAGAVRGRPYAAMVPWLQDPVQNWSESTYWQALELQASCDALEIPVLNRVDRLTNAGKFQAAELMRAAGVRVPRMARIGNAEEFRDTLLGMPLPFFVREDWGHGGLIAVAQTREQARAIALDGYRRPVAVEWVDTRNADGIYRKYRYLACGDAGIAHHLQCSGPGQWITRGSSRLATDDTRAWELDYVGKPDPHHALLQRAREAIGLDMVAFDYGLLPDGSPIVWEANPFPLIQFSTGNLSYRNTAPHRSMCAILRLYLRTAGLAVAERMENFVNYRSG